MPISGLKPKPDSISPDIKVPPVIKIPVGDTVSILALGDSYTIGQSVDADKRWPAQLARELFTKGYFVEKLTIIAQTGWTTSNLIQAASQLKDPGSYTLAFLLIGVNNQYQGLSVHVYKQEFETLLKKSISQVSGENSRVIVLSIPDYGYTPFGLGNQKYISAKIDEFNSENRNIALAYNVCYVDITPLSRRGITEPELVAGDHLHPSANQYSLWVSQLLPIVIEKLN